MNFFDSSVDIDLQYFFNKINSTDEYDFVILMTRKLYSLYRTYVCKNASNSKAVYIVNDAIPFFVDQMKGKSVLIVDDILIHGRTVKKVGRLLQELGVERLDCKVFIVSDKKIVNDLLSSFDNMNFSFELEREIWRKVSRQIVNRIRGTLTPLRSVSCHGKIRLTHNASALLEALNMIFSDVKLLENKDPEFSSVTTYVWRLPLSDEHEVLKAIVDSVYMQLDISEYVSDHVVITPHIFMKPLHENDIAKLFSLLFGSIFNLTKCAQEGVIAEYRFIKFYSSYLSLLAMKKTLCRHSYFEYNDISIDYSDIDFFLPSGMAVNCMTDSFRCLFVETVSSFSFAEYTNSDDSGNIMEGLAKESNISFMRYICECGFADEILCQLNSPTRIEGARIYYLTQKLAIQHIDIVYVLSQSIATLSHRYYQGWVTEQILPGEQAFVHMLFDNHHVLMKVQKQAAVEKLISREKYNTMLVKAYCEDFISNTDLELNSILKEIKKWCFNSGTSLEISMNILKSAYIQYMTDIDIGGLYII